MAPPTATARLKTAHARPRLPFCFQGHFPSLEHNENLREICLATSSNCIMANVRAASKNTGISHPNCHPFKAGRLLFCHNGRIDQFASIRRRFLEQVTDEAFEKVRGTTDSECIFALFLTNLEEDDFVEGSPYAQTKPFGAKRLVAALKRTLHQIENFLEESGLTEGYSTCNFSVTDGDTMVVTRFCDKNPDIPPPSLYFAFGTAKHLYHELTNETSHPFLLVRQGFQLKRAIKKKHLPLIQTKAAATRFR